MTRAEPKRLHIIMHSLSTLCARLAAIGSQLRQSGTAEIIRQRPRWSPTFPDAPARLSCHQAAKLAGWFGAYSALFSMPEMFYIEPVNELVEELTRGAVMAV